MLPHNRFIIALQRLVDMDAEDLNVITSALDPLGKGVVDPVAFMQEAHNHRCSTQPYPLHAESTVWRADLTGCGRVRLGTTIGSGSVAQGLAQ